MENIKINKTHDIKAYMKEYKKTIEISYYNIIKIITKIIKIISQNIQNKKYIVMYAIKNTAN